jgi:uncharacterized protein DUF5994
MIGGVGSISYVGGQACVVLDESLTLGGLLPGDGSTDMMSALVTISGRTSRARPVEAPRELLRLRLKPKAPTEGWVDGGWWPRSRDLAAELPGLLAVLAVRLGRIERVSFHLGDWGPTGGKISCGVGEVRLGGYRTQRADTVDVLAAGSRVTLLVVPPETSAQIAQAVLLAAGRHGNTDDVRTLLRSRPLAPRVFVGSGSEVEAAQERWELDGGRVDVDTTGPPR